MTTVYVAWAVSALVLILAAGWAGRAASAAKNPLRILVDSRGRYSLSQLQIVLWTIVVLSLLAGVFIARLFHAVPNPLDITIPDEVLIVMGISIGSATAAGAIKASKDMKGTSQKVLQARFSQTFTEEGEGDDDIVDITKFQNLWLTLIVIAAYVVSAINYIGTKTDPGALNALPGFNGTLLTLLGISHAGYLAGKLPDKKSPALRSAPPGDVDQGKK